MALANTYGLLKDGNWRGSQVHAGQDLYPVYLEMDWVRYCEGKFKTIGYTWVAHYSSL